MSGYIFFLPALLISLVLAAPPAKASETAVTVKFEDCIGGKIAFGAGVAMYNCYTTSSNVGFNRHYVKFYSLGLSASWARHKPSFHCVMKGNFKDFSQRHFFGGGQVGVSPLLGYKGAAFYNPSTGSHCFMYGMAVGFEADVSGGVLTIIDSGNSYL